MVNKFAYISEIFFSYQGEGLYLLQPLIFIRFTGCNLRCKYCDTKYAWDANESNKVSMENVLEEIRALKEKHFKEGVPFISLTGGEPLLQGDFIVELINNLKNEFKFYLETNGTLLESFKMVVSVVDVASVDIKLPSDSKGVELTIYNRLIENITFVNDLFFKIVVTQNTTDYEIEKVLEMLNGKKFPVIFQPVTPQDGVGLPEPEKVYRWMRKFMDNGISTHLIPQIHKLLWRMR